MGDSRIKDISSLLSSFFNDDRLRKGGRYADFFSSWPSLVGSRLAAHSRVADIEKGLLVIEAEHPGWIQLLQLRQTRILEEVARRYPEFALRGIAFRLIVQSGGVLRAAERVDATTEKLGSTHDSDEDKTQAAKGAALEEIGDPEFQATLKSLKDAILGKPK